VEFDVGKITMKTITAIEKKYLNHADWNKDAIAKASKVAGPLAVWLESACKFGNISINIEPLRLE
jgi:septal ring factor EnvC (AmiA/AmiB activator)